MSKNVILAKYKLLVADTGHALIARLVGSVLCELQCDFTTAFQRQKSQTEFCIELYGSR